MTEEFHGNVDIAVGIEDGNKVVMHWHQAVRRIDFTPHNAFLFAEMLARTAHKAQFGDDVPADGRYLAQQIKAKLTEEMRDKMVQRVALMVTSMLSQGKTHGYMALQIVDTIFAEVE